MEQETLKKMEQETFKKKQQKKTKTFRYNLPRQGPPPLRPSTSKTNTEQQKKSES